MDFQAYLSQKYQGHESFLENIIYPIFGEENYETAWDVELLDSEELRGQAARTGIRSILRCGTISLDLTPLEVFDITVSDRVVMEKNRVGVQTLIRRVMDTYSGAFMLIHYDNDAKWDWRFTFCQVKDKNEFTDSKRYTFLLGPNQSCRTAAQNFKKLADLNTVISIKDIQSAFDVEALSKEFFGKYKNHYERFVEYITGKRFEKEGGKFVEKTKHEPHPVYFAAFGNSDKAVRDYVKLTLGRIILCHFIQKKGWLGVPQNGKWGTGDEQFMRNLYLKASDVQKEDFLESVLEPFFFGGLDTDRRKDDDLFDSCVFGKIRVPYLNGGLFEKNHSDDIEVKFPKEYFADLLEFFSEYNFTIDENDPNEAQVGIDPEMLSQIFENLLEDNKDKGAFYTPKEIVKYMCQESLVAYLVTKTSYEEDRLREFVHNPDVFVSKFSEDEKMILLDAILSVKICDPAIGSGAFPIGLLNELVRCKEAIFGDKKGRADIKREIIRDNIYGVDIEKGAVDIARLRFWLSLVVDEEEPTPLPNLDFKIMQGNSLLEQYKDVDLSHLLDEQVGVISWGEEVCFRDCLSRFLKEYFDCEDHVRKEELQATISGLIKERLDEYSHRGRYGDRVLDMTSINIEANDQFFLWHTWFADVFIDGGFDIIIGNPPYVEAKKLKYIASTLKKKFDIYSGTADLSIYFIEHGINILASSGYLSYITTNKFFNTEYGRTVRHLLLENTISQLINFEQVEVFEGILVSSVILGLAKIPAEESHRFTYEKFEKLGNKEFKALFDSKLGHFGNYKQSFLNDAEWSFADSELLALKLKIEKGSTLLADLPGVHVYRGITTGYNPAFIIDSEVRKRLLLSNASNEIIIKNMLQGRNVRKWYYNQSDEYLLQTGFDLNIKDDYPDIFNHLNQFFEDMVNRSDQGKKWWNLRACQYYGEFEKDEKIIWGLTAAKWAFSLDTRKHYLPSNGYIMTSSEIPCKYLLGVLNSSLLHHYFKYIGVMTAGGAYTLKAATIEALPFKTVGPQDEIIQLVDTILAVKATNHDADVSDEEAKIDLLVYKMYGLTYSEVLLVDPAFDLPENEYNAL